MGSYRRFAATLLAASLAAPLAATQQGAITGVVVESRGSESRRSLLIEPQGPETARVDRVTIDVPRGRTAAPLVPVLPPGWRAEIGDRRVTLSGPPIRPSDLDARVDLDVAAPPRAVKIEIFSGRSRVFSGDVTVADLGLVVPITRFEDVLVVPEVVQPGDEITAWITDPSRFTGERGWDLMLSIPTTAPTIVWPLPVRAAPEPAVTAGQTPAPAGPPSLRVPDQDDIVAAILAGAVKGGLARGQTAPPSPDDRAADLDWTRALNQEAEVQKRLLSDFSAQHKETLDAIREYDAAVDRYKTAFVRLQSGSTELQSLIATWATARVGARRADMATAIFTLGTTGVKLGIGLFRWLRRPADVIEAGAAVARAGDDAAAAAARGGQAPPQFKHLEAALEQHQLAGKNRVEAFAPRVGETDVPALLARHGGDAEKAFAELVTRYAAIHQLTSLTGKAELVLSRLLVAAYNATRGRPGAASAQEIATLRAWAAQPGFWDRLARSAGWVAEPTQLAGIQDAVRLFRRNFTPEDLAVLRRLAESDDLARLATRAGAKADNVPAFAGVDDTTIILPPRAPAPGVDDTTIILPPRAPAPGVDDTTIILPPRAQAPGVNDTTIIFGPRGAPTFRGEMDIPALSARLVPPAAPGADATIILRPNPFETVTISLTPLQVRQILERSRGGETPRPPEHADGDAPSGPHVPEVAAGDARSRHQTPPSDGLAETALDVLGGLPLRLRARYTDKWGFTTVDAEKTLTVVPPGAPAADLTGCTRRAFPGKPFCVCGGFPEGASDQLLIDGLPLGAPISSSRYISWFTMPEKIAAGPHRITGAPSAGFGPDAAAEVLALVVGGEIDQNLLFKGQGTSLRLWIEGTTEPLGIRLRNLTPQIISVEGGADQIIATSGGTPNELTRTARGTTPGAFRLEYSLDGDACPCSGTWTAPPIDVDALANALDEVLEAQADEETADDPPPLPTFAGPKTLDELLEEDGIDSGLWLAANGDRVAEAFLETRRLIADRRGWPKSDPRVTVVADRLLSNGADVVTGEASEISRADFDQLAKFAAASGFWSWLGAMTIDTPIGPMPRYAKPEVDFLEAMLESKGDAETFTELLGPVKTAAIRNAASKPAAPSPQAAEAARAYSSASPIAGLNADTLFGTFWGENQVFKAARFYGLTSGQDPAPDDIGWMVVNEAYNWLTSPLESTYRYTFTRTALEAYTAYLNEHREDLLELNRASSAAINALRRIDTAAKIRERLLEARRDRAELSRILGDMQRIFDRASPAWKKRHETLLTARRRHIETKLADLTAASAALAALRARLPHMIESLEQLQRNPDGSTDPLKQFNPELWVRLGSIAVFLDHLAGAATLPSADAKRPAGPVGPDRKALGLDALLRPGTAR